MSSRSVSAAPARERAWASMRATVVSTERSSGVKVTGWVKPAIHAPIVRPATVSGRNAQDCRPNCSASGQAVG